MTWLAQMEARRLVLSLREMLVRLDENLAAHTLMEHCVPYICEGDPEIERARADQAQMVDHIVGESYATYYENNHHERPFEEQYQCSPEEAHERLHRVRFLRRWLEAKRDRDEEEDGELRGPLPTLLDCACNDGWMAVNLDALVMYHGIDLNPHCVERARGRREAVGAMFLVGFAEDAPALARKFAAGRSQGDADPEGYDVVVAYELVEHVRDPAHLLDVMVSVCRPGGSLFVSTPLGAGTGGDLPNWWFVEPKGHVRAYTPSSFGALLAPHGEVHIEISQTVNAGQLMVARVELPGIVAGDARQPVRAHRAGGQGDPRPPAGPRAARR